MTTLLRKHLLLGRELYFLLIKGVYLILAYMCIVNISNGVI